MIEDVAGNSTFQEIAESVAREYSPYVWDGRLCESFTRTSIFTDEQAAEIVAEEQAEKLEEAKEYLSLFYPLIEKQIREQIAREIEDQLPAGGCGN